MTKKNILKACLIFFLSFPTSLIAEVDRHDFEEFFEIVSYEPNTLAPGFSALDLQDNEYQLKDYQNKFVLLNFWATWCLPCVRELPQLEKLRKTLPENKFQILAINVRDRVSRVKKFLNSRSFQFNVLLDQTGEIYKSYDVKNFPMTFLINQQGMLVSSIYGERNWVNPDFLKYMKLLIKEGERDE